MPWLRKHIALDTLYGQQLLPKGSNFKWNLYTSHPITIECLTWMEQELLLEKYLLLP